MPKFKVEYKTTQRNEDGVSTHYTKMVTESPRELLLALGGQPTSDVEIDFITVRKVVERPAKPEKKEAKK